MLRRLLTLLAAAACFACAAEPPSDAVRYENLYEREQFWPYHVRLVEDWKPEGFAGERIGHGLGVLVRVERSGELRVDFARHGVHRVPARVTDVLDAANRIRLDPSAKGGPNFVVAISNKLLDPIRDPVGYLLPAEIADHELFLLVAADPLADDFAELAAALRAASEREGVLLVLLPQGGRDGAELLEQLRRAQWRGALVVPRFAAAYTESIVGEPEALPAVLLQTGEGRLLYAASWSAEASRELGEAIDRALDAAPSAQRVP